MLTKLVLENFKRHADLTVDLSTGLNLITGPNYTGKSSLLQAIRYAFEGASAIPGGKAVSTRHGETNHKVELSMQVNGKEYVITRTLTKATLTRDGEVIAKSASAVTNHIAELLGMSGQRFGQLRYAQQKKTDALLTVGATELHKIVGEVSRVEIVNDVITRCGTAISECNGGLSVLPVVDTTQMQEQADSLQASLQAVHTELISLVGQIDEGNRELHLLEVAYLEAGQKNAKVETENRERTRLSEESERLVAGIDAAKLKAASLFGADDKLKSLQESLGYINQGVITLTGKVAELNLLDRERNSIVTKLQATSAEVERFKVLLDEHPDEILTAEMELVRDSLVQSITMDQSEFNTLKASAASMVCPTCKRPYEQGPEALTKIDSRMKELSGRLAELRARDTRVCNELTAANTSNDSLRQTTDRLDSAQGVHEAQKNHLSALLDKIDPLVVDEPIEALEELDTKARQYKEMVDSVQVEALALNSATTELNTLDRRFGEVLDKVTELGDIKPIQDLSGLSNKVTTLETEISQLTSVYTPKSHEYTRLTGSLEVLNREIADATAQALRRAGLEARLGTATALGKYLRKNRDRFLSTVWSGVMSRASAFASACTGGDVTELRRGDNGKFTFVEDGVELPVAAASGAQQSILGLGTQLALAEMLPSPLETVLLDEPSADADEEISLTMAAVLAANHGQLLVVSHRALDSAAANNLITLER